MSVIDNAKTVLGDIKTRKEEWVKEHPDTPDAPTMIVSYRGDELVAMVQVTGDADVLLTVVNAAVAGFCADYVSLVFETWHSNLVNNPATGQRWERGEMEELVLNHPDARAKGWVGDAVTSMVFGRGEEDYFFASLPFEIKEGEVIWNEEKEEVFQEGEEAKKMDGYIVESMRQIMGMPTIRGILVNTIGQEKLDALTEDLGETLAMAHQDIATMRHVMTMDGVLGAGLTAARDSERQLILQTLVPRAFDKSQIVNLNMDKDDA